jgi:MoxR-like ATPase
MILKFQIEVADLSKYFSKSKTNTMNQEGTLDNIVDINPTDVTEQITSSAEAPDIQQLNEKVEKASKFTDLIRLEMSKTIIGQTEMVDKLLIGLLANGHVLLEGVPGLAKTLAINTLSSAIDAQFSRIQFTPDLLPADVVGTMIYNPREESFKVKKGPIFANFVLADEINRAPAKVQSALLEAMQERQVTIGNETFEVPDPFLVLATQNPVEQEGTYPLPEAQVDRFLLKVVIGYPTKEEEQQILRSNLSVDGLPKPKPVVSTKEVLKARKLVRSIYLDEKVEKYIVDLVFATRSPENVGLGHLTELISFGASPRASIGLGIAAKAHAFLDHRGYVTPEDVRAVAMDVMRHRVGLTFEAEAENITQEQIVTEIMDSVIVP